jgi:hypothetical protein
MFIDSFWRLLLQKAQQKVQIFKITVDLEKRARWRVQKR